MAFRVCFVCLGNICRSPTAAAVMRRLVAAERLDDRIEVDSAGLGSWHVGGPADRRAVAEARRHGIDLSHTARQFATPDFQSCDLVLAMDEDNYAALSALAPDSEARSRIRFLREFEPDGAEDLSVPDPYYGDGDGFGEVFDICERSCRGLLDRLRRDL